MNPYDGGIIGDKRGVRQVFQFVVLCPASLLPGAMLVLGELQLL